MVCAINSLILVSYLSGVYSLILEGDVINIILAIQKLDLFKDWNFFDIF
jgi:hypothetical protein